MCIFGEAPPVSIVGFILTVVSFIIHLIGFASPFWNYKSKRSVKQVNIDNKERERLEAVVINTLRLHQTIISNMVVPGMFPCLPL
jgi:hypothetical protein